MIAYRTGYKYQLAQDVSIDLEIYPKEAVNADFLYLSIDGIITIYKGYAWDGASGPAIDTKNFMRGALVHDALYQLIRQGYLDKSLKAEADLELWRLCREDGMSRLRAWWVHRAVKLFGSTALKEPRPIVNAP